MVKENKKMEDRISHLPDVLIHHILSSLNTQKVVQTCVLSKRWKTLWTHIPTLNFHYQSYDFYQPFFKYWMDDKSKERSFKYFIIRVLSRHCATNIQKLSFTSSSSKDEGLLIELLICYAGSHKVQQLFIDTFDIGIDIGIYNWKYSLSTCSSLTVLKIICKFDDDWGALTLPSLRVLEIEPPYEAEVNYADYAKFGTNFSCFPNLVSLTFIDYLFNNTSISICSPKLENLEIYTPFDSELAFPKVQLLTPCLKSVKFSHTLPTIKSDSEFSCIHKVNIELKDDCFESNNDSLRQKLTSNFNELLRVFENASSFVLPLKATQVISSQGLSFRNMRHLRLKTDKTNDMLLAYLLERYLNLETFVVLKEGYKEKTIWN